MELFYRRLFILISVIFLSASCGEEVPLYTIPWAPVNFTVDLNGLDFELREPLAYKTFTEKRRTNDRIGYAGLLFVADLSGNTIFAYDLTCPFEDNKSIKIEPLSDGKAKCNTCGSVFVTMHGLGNAESGPSKEALQRYTIEQIQPGLFYVVN